MATTQHVVVDGSNIATEGRSTPSLAQLETAVAELRKELPEAEVTVVVDATFAHRIDGAELERFEQAALRGEYVYPPAGAIGRGDAFLLRIAERVDGVVLSNDSFQEFHGEHEWLFDRGRLLGATPVPGVGWIFVPRTPVRGPRSRVAVRDAGRAKEQVVKAIAQATREVVEPVSKGIEPASARRSRGRSTGQSPQAVNDPMTFISFIAEHPLGEQLDGLVDSFTSHGAVVHFGEVRCYVPLSGLGSPAPRAAREVLRRGETRTFVITALDPFRRGVELALPGVAVVSGRPSDETVAAEVRMARAASARPSASLPPSRRGTGTTRRAQLPAASAPEEAAVSRSPDGARTRSFAPTPLAEAPPSKTAALKEASSVPEPMKTSAVAVAPVKSRAAKSPAGKNAPAKAVAAESRVGNGVPAKVAPARSPAAKTPAAKSPAARSPAAKSPAAKSPAAKSPAAKVRAAKGAVAESPAAKVAPAKVAPAKVAPAKSTATKVRAPAEAAAESGAGNRGRDKSVADKSVAAKSRAPKVAPVKAPAATAPAVTAPAVTAPAAKAPAAKVPAAKVPAAEVPAAKAPAAKAPAAKAPAAKAVRPAASAAGGAPGMAPAAKAAPARASASLASSGSSVAPSTGKSDPSAAETSDVVATKSRASSRRQPRTSTTSAPAVARARAASLPGVPEVAPSGATGHERQSGPRRSPSKQAAEKAGTRTRGAGSGTRSRSGPTT